ncbi:MAG TPA: poly(A) polymerase [Nitrospirota bacterium]|nr:poly(A) polymerase [Nitrospirota bacterium]
MLVSPIQPTIIPRSEHDISRKWISPNAVRVLYRLKEQGYFAYLVGGGVRDLLLGREPKDFDIATDAKPHEVKKIFRNCRLIGRRFRLAHIHFHGEIIEVATFRSNVLDEMEEVEGPTEKETSVNLQEQAGPGAPTAFGLSGQGTVQPSPAEASAIAASAAVPAKTRPPRMLKTEDGMILRDNVFGTPEEDALRRDFTVNALFYAIADFSVIDYVGGMQDLRNGLIRTIGDPQVRFTEDPVRMVRAVRFAAMLGFEIEEKTYDAILELKEKVALASPARMYEEVLKLFLLGEGERTYQLLRKTGLFGVIFPRLNDWLDTEESGFPHVWIGKALEWVDTCVHGGRKVEPHVLFGLMFGQYIEEKSAGLMKSGTPALDAVTKAVAEVLSEQAQRVMIPRKVVLPMRDMYWNQQRFEKREGKHPRYFLRRPGFEDAYEYLRFTSEVTGERKELRFWWKDFIKANPVTAGEERSEDTEKQQRAKYKRPMRRRRRGGGRGKQDGPKPKN